MGLPSESVRFAVLVRVNHGPYTTSSPTPTETGPLEQSKGTVATICVSLQLVTAGTAPGENCTVLLLCAAPKPVPVTVMLVPMGPEFCEMPVMESVESTVNVAPLLVTPSTVTVTGPLVAFEGTCAVMLVSLQELTLATTLLNFTWLVL